jgi:ABC-type sugar transport system ATPase subunit
MIFQELNLFSNMSVAENIFATREITRGILGIDHKAQVEKANAFLDGWMPASAPRPWSRTCRSASSSWSRSPRRCRSMPAS